MSELGEAVREPYCASEANADDSGVSTGVTTTCWPARRGGVRGGVHVRSRGDRDAVGLSRSCLEAEGDPVAE